MKIAVVEDEPVVAMDIVANIEEMGYQVVGPFDSGEEFLKTLKSAAPDLVLMDIQIAGKLDGVETAEIINSIASLPIIFITASSDKVTKERAQKVRPHAYIIKPFNFLNLNSAIELALFNYHSSKTTVEVDVNKLPKIDGYPGTHSIFVRQTKSRRFQKLELASILIFEAKGSYTNIITEKENLVICSNLQLLLDKIESEDFIRVHRSFAINLKQIQSVTDEELTVGTVNVPISLSYRKKLFEQLNIL